jgi:hypothetical protein
MRVSGNLDAACSLLQGRGVGTLIQASNPIRRRGRAAVALFTAAALYTSGCLSHEYRLPRDELTRLAAMPPDGRGAQVRVVQKLGMRRAPALDPSLPSPGSGPWSQEHGPGPWYGPEYDDPVVYGGVHGDFVIPVGGGGRGRPHYPRGGGPPVKAPPVGRPAAGPVPAQPVSAPAGSWRGDTGRPAPSGGGIGLPSSGGGGGGGGGKDDIIVYAVVAIAVASLAAVGLAVTEGLRFDGDIAAAPGQLLYLQSPGRPERPVPVAQLTVADLAGVDGAILRDDEGFGLYRLGRAPLDRRGFAFKVDVGGTQASLDRDLLSGLASHIQLGYFPHQRLGLLGGVSLAVGQGLLPERRFARHALEFEAQLFPLSWRRLHVGGAAHVGSGLIRHQSGDVDGALTVGGGALLEIALTTRLALHARLDWSASRTSPTTWSNARSLSAGLAIY